MSGLLQQSGTGAPSQERSHAWLIESPLRNHQEEQGDIPLDALTVVEGKRHHYPIEAYFRESFADGRATLGPALLPTLHRYALIIFKPDAVAGRRIERALTFLTQHALTPVHAFRRRLSRLVLREDWRFQLNQLTLDRMRLNTILAEMGDALFVILRDDSESPTIPASVRLQSIKGPSYPHLQTPAHLRFVLGAWNRLLKFIHTPDEPGDLVREIGILMEMEERCALYARMASLNKVTDMSQVQEAVDELYREILPHPLEFEPAKHAVLQSLRARSGGSGETRAFLTKLEAVIERVPQGGHLNWQAFERDLTRLGIKPDWNYIVMAAGLIQHSLLEERAIIVGDGSEGWLSGRGLFAPS